MPYDPNNVFAKILRGELPCVKIYEDAQTLSFMDIAPSVEGHTLVIPKEAAERVTELSPESAVALMRTTQKVATAVKKGLECPALMLVELDGTDAGQSVPHVHFHILPRRAGLDLKFHGRAMVDPKTLEPIAAKIRAAL